ncbi:MAG: hypothetical protein ACE15F_10015 [bacterium]
MRDILPAAESRYRAWFLFDVNSLTMADGDQHVLLSGEDPDGFAWEVQHRFSSGDYQLRLAVFDDARQAVETPWFSIPDDQHSVEIE